MNKTVAITLLCTAVFCLAGCDNQTKNVNTCGDGFLDPGEECDGDLGEVTCTSLGHYNPLGTLTCRADCLYDRTGCGGRCGDGIIDIEYGEVCDGANLNQTCRSLGYHGGDLTCAADCGGHDLTGCEDAGRCGDGVLQEQAEDCDGDDLGGATCDDLGFYRGTLACSTACVFDTTGCAERCGDGVVQSADGEACDGSDLAGQTCESLGFHQGDLACAACALDTSACEGRCGDGLVQADHEACDGENLNGETCESQGFYRGTLTCGQCVLLADGCERCGDGVIQIADGEQCELGDLGDGTCRDLDLFFGGPACQSGCVLATGTCKDLLQWGAPGASVTVSSVTVDGTGHVVVAGWTSATLDGQPVVGLTDIFVTRFGPDGRRLWTRTWGGGNGDKAWAVVTDDAGDIYIAGQTENGLNGNTLSGYNDAFLMKIGADGVAQWTRQWGSTGTDDGHAVAVNGAGSIIYLAGITNGDLDGQPGSGNTDVFLTRFDAAGVRQWTRLWGTGHSHEVYGLAVDPSGNTYLAGKTEGPLNGEPTIGSGDAFLMKVAPSGDPLWTRIWGTVEQDLAFGVAYDDAGLALVTGTTSGSLDGEPYAGGSDIFLVAFDPSGTRLWTSQWGTTDNDQGSAVAVDLSGSITVTGTTFGALEGQTNAGFNDVFITRLHTAGVRQWTRQLGSVWSDRGRSVAMDAAGHAYVAGTAENTLPGQTTVGDQDAFLLFIP